MPPRLGTLGTGHARKWPYQLPSATVARLPMSKPPAFPALAQFVAATAGRNMTNAAYLAVSAGVVMMLVLTVAPAYEAAHHWVDAVLWACLAFFLFEWVVRLRHAFRRGAGGATRCRSAAWWTRSPPWPFRSPSFSAPVPNQRGCWACSGCSRWCRGFRGCGSCAGCWCWNPARC